MLDKKFWKNKRVLVTGHTGFKGSWLTQILLTLGAEVSGYALEPNTENSLYSMLKLNKEINSIIGDITDIDKVISTFAAINPEIVIHMAAQPIVRVAYADPVNTFKTNVMGTVNILEAIRYTNTIKSVINVTTDKVYQNNEWLWGYRESDILCGQDPYSNSKSCSELVTYSYINSFFADEHAPAISTARSGNVIGGGDFSPNRIIPDCFTAAKMGSVIEVRNPNSIRPYQHVLECLNGYLSLAELQFVDKSKYMGSYNFGPRQEDCLTTGEITELFCKSWGNGLRWVSQKAKGPHEANFLKLDCSKAHTVLGWEPKWSLSQAINSTVEIYKALIYSPDSIKDIIINQIEEFNF